jgi:hypothetical protein
MAVAGKKSKKKASKKTASNKKASKKKASKKKASKKKASKKKASKKKASKKKASKKKASKKKASKKKASKNSSKKTTPQSSSSATADDGENSEAILVRNTHIVKAGDFGKYAETRESEDVVPELINHLARASLPDATVCRIPYGDDVRLMGLDGITNSRSGCAPFVPAGYTCWEIGVGKDPQTKATNDFRKRTKPLNKEKLSGSSFVFVTPRSGGSGGWQEPEQTKWIERRKKYGWRDIRIIDGVILAEWLKEFPALGRWMAKKIGVTPSLGGIITPREHWEIVSHTEGDDPPFPPDLFIASRDSACAAIESIFSGDVSRLLLFAESEKDVEDFVAAYLCKLDKAKGEEYANRCLFISDEEAWRTVSELRQSHVLIASPRLSLESELSDLQRVATRNGHGVVIPLCGAYSTGNPDIIKLRSPSDTEIERVLRQARFTDIRAKELGRIGGGRLSALRRHVLGLGTLPPYASWDVARELAQAGIAGQWDAKNVEDIKVIEKLLGKGYGEWIETLRDDVLRSDSPLVQSDEKWRMVVRGESWNSLGNRITDEDLVRLQEIAVEVLEEKDPALDLPKKDRFAASIYGADLKHSILLRQGLAETLALLGSRPKSLSECSLGKPEITARLVVKKLLGEVSWERLASLDYLMPLLAEASPDEFLDSIEFMLSDLKDNPFHELFAQEGPVGSLDGRSYICGLLWALESLAWHQDYLPRVSVILADLASIDPGGSWTNRPANSLTDIFLPWHVQTTAPLEIRLAAVKVVLNDHAEVGWTLLLSLLPHAHGHTSGCNKPIWRDFIPRNWDGKVLRSEYQNQIKVFVELAVELAKDNTDRLGELVARLADLPLVAHAAILGHLSSDKFISLPETIREKFWTKLDELVKRHRNFNGADWALPEEAISKIEHAAKLLAPKSPVLKYQYLFSDRIFALFDDDDYTSQQERLKEARINAVSEIYLAGGVKACIELASSAASPHDVGRTLSDLDNNDIEHELLPSHLNIDDTTIAQVVGGFIWSQYWRLKEEWVESNLDKDWCPLQKAKLLLNLPFGERTWCYVTDSLKGGNEHLYWEKVQFGSYGPEQDYTVAIRKLLEYERPGAAVMCSASSARHKPYFDEKLAVDALTSVLTSDTGIDELNANDVVELITQLQKSGSVDEEALFKIEWNYLAWLDQFSVGSPVTLQMTLSKSPEFFAEIITKVYRSENEEEEIPDKTAQLLASNAYRLLNEWKQCPGVLDDGTFDVDAFVEWVSESRRITKESGHARVAQLQIGQVLPYAPKDPGGLWIHEAVAAVLNQKDAGEMRSGFTTELFNSRGVQWYDHGKTERGLAITFRDKAKQLDLEGYTRFAAEIREFAERYDQMAEQEEKNNPH